MLEFFLMMWRSAKLFYEEQPEIAAVFSIVYILAARLLYSVYCLRQHNRKRIRYVLKQTPLMRAVIRSDYDEVRRLLELDSSNINAADVYKTTALMHAVRKSQIEIVNLLLQHGADVNKRDQDEVSTIAMAYREASQQAKGSRSRVVCDEIVKRLKDQKKMDDEVLKQEKSHLNDGISKPVAQDQKRKASCAKDSKRENKNSSLVLDENIVIDVDKSPQVFKERGKTSNQKKTAAIQAKISNRNAAKEVAAQRQQEELARARQEAELHRQKRQEEKRLRQAKKPPSQSSSAVLVNSLRQPKKKKASPKAIKLKFPKAVIRVLKLLSSIKKQNSQQYYKAYVYGGMPRDLMWRVSYNDADVVTSLSEEALRACLEKAKIDFIKTNRAGLYRFSVGKLQFDVVCAPIIDDMKGLKVYAEKLDFANNALFCAADRIVIDPLGRGVEANKEGCIVPAGTADYCLSDRLRIIRLARLSCCKKVKSIDDPFLKKLYQLKWSFVDVLRDQQNFRLIEQLKKLFQGRRFSYTFFKLWNLRLISKIFQDVFYALQGNSLKHTWVLKTLKYIDELEKNGQSHSYCFDYFLAALSIFSNPKKLSLIPSLVEDNSKFQTLRSFCQADFNAECNKSLLDAVQLKDAAKMKLALKAGANSNMLKFDFKSLLSLVEGYEDLEAILKEAGGKPLSASLVIDFSPGAKMQMFQASAPCSKSPSANDKPGPVKSV